jgi:hypothetical protein
MRLQSFVKNWVNVCQEYFSSYPCSCSVGLFRKLREETDDDYYLESIKSAESKVEDLANFIAKKLDIHHPPSDDEADN